MLCKFIRKEYTSFDEYYQTFRIYVDEHLRNGEFTYEIFKLTEETLQSKYNNITSDSFITEDGTEIMLPWRSEKELFYFDILYTYRV